MRVLLTSHGSTGDIFPLIGYGRALKERGHHVRYATAPLFAEAIEAAGLEFVHLPPDWSKPLFAEFMRDLNRLPLPLLQLRHIYREAALPVIGELVQRMDATLADNTDALVSSYFFPHYRTLAARHNIPFATFAFCHNLIPSDRIAPEGFPPAHLIPAPLRRGYCRAAWALANSVVDFTVNSVCKKAFAQNGLGKSRNFISDPAELCMAGVSPGLMDWFPHEPRHRFVGYLRWQSPQDEAVGKQLEAFCAGEKVPVLTFGSVTFDDVHGIMSRFLRNWPHGKKIIIQSGWAGLSVDLERPEIKVVGTLSHDQLFSFASVVIHHGGAGTTASVLHAGCPQIIIPHIADQNWWGSEVRRLGTGRVLAKRRWPENLPAQVAKAEQCARTIAAAKHAAQILAAENGAQTAVDTLEDFVASKQAELQAASR